MPVTITAGITFSGGGLTMAFAPPSTATAGWYGGGRNGPIQSTIDRITYATDTATATVRGPLSVGIVASAGTGNLTDGWSGGGQTAASSPGAISTVNRITYATDTATASVRGPLSSARFYLAATGNTSDGWFGGGVATNGLVPGVADVDRITFATDTATASVRGALSLAAGRLAAAGTNTNGWFAGQWPGNASTVQRITYATDTATASVRGPLAQGVNSISASSDYTTYGWWAGGSGAFSIVQRITYATDTATASVRGPLSSSIGYTAATGSDTAGWIAGGFTATSTVDRITYATDTATASVRGPLSSARYGAAGTSGIQ